MNRKGPWEGEVSLVVSFPPSFACTFSSTERETSGYEAVAEMYPDRMWTTPSSCFVLKFLQSSLIYLLFRLERSHYERKVDISQVENGRFFIYRAERNQCFNRDRAQGCALKKHYGNENSLGFLIPRCDFRIPVACVQTPPPLPLSKNRLRFLLRGGGLACTRARFQLNEHIDPLAHPFLRAARADILCTYFFIPWFKYTDVIHVFIVSYMSLNYERIPLQQLCLIDSAAFY